MNERFYEHIIWAQILLLTGFAVYTLTIIYSPDTVLALNYDHEARMGCETDSMGLNLECGDMVYGDDITNKTVLIPGRIYVYKKDNENIVHRLAYCLEPNCTQAVFRGDNNPSGELVNRSQIMYSVDWIQKT